MTTLTITQATQPQINFITDLIAGKNLGETTRAKQVLARIAASELTKAEASKLIDELKTAKKLEATTPTASGKTPMQALLSQVPKSRYAVSTDSIDLGLVDENVNGDYIFVEVREYMDSLYIRRLHGAPGGFNRTKLSFADTKVIVDVIAKNPLEHTQKFGELYACCGKCGADLTDQTSRELKLGPTCRKEFGV